MKPSLTILAVAALGLAPSLPLSAAAPPASAPATTQPAAAAGAPSEGFQLSIRPSAAQATAVEPVAVVLTVTNVADEPLSFVETNPEREFRLTVTDAAGHAVPPTRYGEPLLRRDDIPVYRRFFVDLQPREQAHYALWLSRIYDLSVPGVYQVRAEFSIAPRQAKGADRLHVSADLVSNTMRVEITEPQQPSTQPQNAATEQRERR